MKRHWSTRLVGATLALAFGLAMAGPEVHQCPQHDPAPTQTADHSSHGDHQRGDQSDGICTCPQVCCPVGVGVALPAQPVVWTTVAAFVNGAVPVGNYSFRPSTPAHLLPFALAPPRALV